MRTTVAGVVACFEEYVLHRKLRLADLLDRHNRYFACKLIDWKKSYYLLTDVLDNSIKNVAGFMMFGRHNFKSYNQGSYW